MTSGWKHKAMALLLTGSTIMGVAGCRKKSTTETTLEKREESVSGQTENTNPIPVEIQEPSERFMEQIKENFGQGLDSSDAFFIGADGSFKFNPLMSNLDANQTPQFFYYLFSEEAFQKAKEQDKKYAGLSLEEYRDRLKEDYPQYLKFLDDRFQLKDKLPPERIMIFFPSTYVFKECGNDKLMECLQAGIELLYKDERIKSRLQDTVSSDDISGEDIQQVNINYSLDEENNIVVNVELLTYAQESTLYQTTIAWGKDVENEVFGPPYITTWQAKKDYADKIYKPVHINLNYAFFDKLESLRKEHGANEQRVPELDSDWRLSVEFLDAENNKYFYYGDGKWAYSNSLYGIRSCFEVPLEQENDKIVDEMLTYLCLSTQWKKIGLKESYTCDLSNCYSDSRLSPKYKNANKQEISYCFGEDDETWKYSVLLDGTNRKYNEDTVFKLMNNYTGALFEIWDDHYEYAENETEKYYRVNLAGNEYSEADHFEGNGNQYLLLLDPTDPCTFEYGFTVGDDENSYAVEIYKSNDSRLAVFLDQDGMPFAGWQWFEKTQNENDIFREGFAIIESIQTTKEDTDLTSYFEVAKQNPAQIGPNQSGSQKSKADQIRDEQKRLGLPDLTAQVVKGKTYQDSPVVQSFFDNLAKHDDFTLEYYTLEEYFSERSKITTRGYEFVAEITAESADHSEPLSNRIWKTNGIADIPDAESIGEPGKNDSFWENYSDQLPKAFVQTKYSFLIEAYDATLNGEPYIVEEWEVGNRGNKQRFLYFCKDGRVVGFRRSDMKLDSVTHIVSLRDGTDEALFSRYQFKQTESETPEN
ncbi:MAG: hypothetical protein IKD90_06270 [Clostridiales bacterium]|nr:hypothetical protein [Clostridiales bacterium]